MTSSFKIRRESAIEKPQDLEISRDTWVSFTCAFQEALKHS